MANVLRGQIYVTKFDKKIRDEKGKVRKGGYKEQSHNDDLLLLTANGRSLSDYIRCFRHICHAPLTMGTLLVSAGAAVITPQRRFARAPQGSSQVFRRP